VEACRQTKKKADHGQAGDSPSRLEARQVTLNMLHSQTAGSSGTRAQQTTVIEACVRHKVRQVAAERGEGLLVTEANLFSLGLN